MLIALNFHAVLRAICRNPDGQFWAGDTAQTISVGSSFRFDDLKAFLHRNEASKGHHFQHICFELILDASGAFEAATHSNVCTPSTQVVPACHQLPLARRDSGVCALSHSSYHKILAICNRHFTRGERDCRWNKACFLQWLGSGQCQIRIIPLRHSVRITPRFLASALNMLLQRKSGRIRSTAMHLGEE